MKDYELEYTPVEGGELPPERQRKLGLPELHEDNSDLDRHIIRILHLHGLGKIEPIDLLELSIEKKQEVLKYINTLLNLTL